MSALQMACSYRRPDLIIYLLDKGADPNVKDSMGATPFLTVCASGMTEAVQRMLDLGVDPVQFNRHQQSTLHLASKSGSSETMILLLPHYNDVNLLDQFGVAPLSYAVWSNQESVVRLLIDHGAKADFDSPLPGLQLPLLHASSLGSHQVVATLLGCGANPDVQDAVTGRHRVTFGRLCQWSRAQFRCRPFVYHEFSRDHRSSAEGQGGCQPQEQ